MSDKLSLKARKNIRDTEPKFKAHAARIKKALDLPVDITLDLDWKDFNDAAKEAGYEDRAGDIFHESTMAGLADNIESHSKDPLVKTAVLGAWTTGVIQHRFVEDTEETQQLAFENGNLVHLCKRTNLYSSCSYFGHDLLKRLPVQDNGLPVEAEKNIKAAEPEVKKLLAKIKKDLQLPVDVTIDWDLVDMEAAAKEIGYPHRLGDIQKSLLSGLADYCEKYGKDDMVREAIQEAWTTGVITHRWEEEPKDTQNTAFEGGNLVHICKRANLYSSCSYWGSDIEAHL